MRPSQRALGLVSGLVSVKEGGDESWSSLVAVGQEVDVMEWQLQLRIGSERQEESEKTGSGVGDSQNGHSKCFNGK